MFHPGLQVADQPLPLTVPKPIRPMNTLRSDARETLIKSAFVELVVCNLLIFQHEESRIWIKSVLPQLEIMETS